MGRGLVMRNITYKEFRLSDPVDFGVTPRQFVYVLWGIDDACLYVGQHTGIHPAIRVSQHRNSTWWSEVVAASYYEVEGDLDSAEAARIWQFGPRYNTDLPPAPPSKRRVTKRVLEPAAKTVSRACQRCGRSFEQVAGRGRPRKYCSDSHRVMAHRAA